MDQCRPHQSRLDKIRLGIVGLGNIGKYHAGYLLEGKIERCELRVGSLLVDFPLRARMGGTVVLGPKQV